MAVPIFGNKTFYRGLEFELTEAVIKEIQDRTPYTVADERAADTVLRGTVSRVTQTRLSRVRRGGVPQEVEVGLVVDFQWIDLRTGRVLRGRKGFVSVGSIRAHAPGEPAVRGRPADGERAAGGGLGIDDAGGLVKTNAIRRPAPVDRPAIGRQSSQADTPAPPDSKLRLKSRPAAPRSA